MLWRYTPVIWKKDKQICGVVEIYSHYLKKKINKYVVLWRCTPVIWKKDTQIRCVVEICSRYLKNKDKQICGVVEIYSRYVKKKNKQICGVVEIYSRHLKKRYTNTWCCRDILRLFEKKINKYMVLWRYTPVIWKKDKQICGVVEIYSGYLKKR